MQSRRPTPPGSAPTIVIALGAPTMPPKGKNRGKAARPGRPGYDEEEDEMADEDDDDMPPLPPMVTKGRDGKKRLALKAKKGAMGKKVGRKDGGR